MNIIGYSHRSRDYCVKCAQTKFSEEAIYTEVTQEGHIIRPIYDYEDVYFTECITCKGIL